MPSDRVCCLALAIKVTLRVQLLQSLRGCLFICLLYKHLQVFSFVACNLSPEAQMSLVWPLAWKGLRETFKGSG